MNVVVTVVRRSNKIRDDARDGVMWDKRDRGMWVSEDYLKVRGEVNIVLLLGW